MSEWKTISLDDLISSGQIELGRGEIISKDDIQNYPGQYPIYSSSASSEGKFGEYGKYIFDEELISWSIDGGGYFFYRPKHKFSVTNVSGYLRIKNNQQNYKFIYYSLAEQHRYFTFDYMTKAHPSVIRKMYHIPLISEKYQNKIATILSTIDETILHTEALIEKYQQIKAGMMNDLFTRGVLPDGTLRPTRDEAPELYHETPIGWIPKEWEISPLSSLCHKITDGSHQAVITSLNGDIPFLFVSCIRDDKVIWEQAARVDNKTYKDISKGREPKEGVILYAAVGSYGFAARLTNSDPLAFQRHIAYIMPDETKVSSKYLIYWLNSIYSKRHADRVAVGNAQKTVTLTELSQFPILLPPEHEQSTIHNILKILTQKISITEIELLKLKKQKSGLMHDLLTGEVSVKTAQE